MKTKTCAVKACQSVGEWHRQEPSMPVLGMGCAPSMHNTLHMGGACGRFGASWVGHGAWFSCTSGFSLRHGLGAQHAQSVGRIGDGLRCTNSLEHHGLG